MNVVTVSAENVCKMYDDKIVLKNFHCKLYSGSVTAVTGPNGSGKSTLLKVLSGLTSPSAGKIHREKNHNVSFVSAEVNPYGELSLKDNSRLITGSSKTCGTMLMDYLEKFSLTGKLNDSYNKLSSGMKQKFKLAAAMSRDSEIMFLDEPSLSLDVNSKKIFFEIIKGLKNKTIVIATNDPEESSLCPDKISLQ